MRRFPIVPLLLLAVDSECIVHSLSAMEPPITSVAFSPDGKTLVTGSQAGVRAHSWPALKPIRTIKVEPPNIHDVTFSPEGDRLAVAGGSPSELGIVEILSWPEGKSLHTLKRHGDSVMAVRWKDAATIASASLDRSILLREIKGEKLTHELLGHSRGVSALCFLDDGKTLISGGIDKSLRVWNAETGKLVRSLSMHTHPVTDLALRPAGEGLPMVASASEDRSVRLWQPTIGRMVRFVRLKSKPLCIAWRDEAHLVAACTDGAVRLIDADNVKVIKTVEAANGWAYTVAVHPTDGSVAVGGQAGQLRRVMLIRKKP